MTHPRDSDPLYVLPEPDMDLIDDYGAGPRIRRDPRRALAYLVLGAVAVAIVILALLVAPPGAGGLSQLPAVEAPTNHSLGIQANEPAPFRMYSLAPAAADGEQESDGGGIAGLPPTDTASGWATYCAPTPTRCQSWGHGRLLGAVRSFRWGDRPYRVTVWHEGHHVTVTVVSYCACGDRRGRPTLIDLSPAAFGKLAPLSQGVIEVTLGRGGGPLPTLPATSTAAVP